MSSLVNHCASFAKLAPAGTRLAKPCINELGARAGASGFGLAGVLGRGCVASSVGRIEAGLAEAEVGGSSVEAVSRRFLCYEACRKGSQGSHSTHMTLQETTMHERREKLEHGQLRVLCSLPDVCHSYLKSTFYTARDLNRLCMVLRTAPSSQSLVV